VCDARDETDDAQEGEDSAERHVAHARHHATAVRAALDSRGELCYTAAP
jgi:hypothetical protein